MKLFFRKIGEGKPLVILHGVFGSSDNLFTVSKRFAEHNLAVYILDARNHGQSPHTKEHNYQVMSEDLAEFIEEEKLDKPIILGHSMGGKTVLQYAQNYSNYEKLIIVDIAPKLYPSHHQQIIKGLHAIEIETLKSRKEADETFAQYVKGFAERQFILKNIYRTAEGGFSWRINVPVLAAEIDKIGSEIQRNRVVEKPVLFIRGTESNYIGGSDFDEIKKDYVNAKLESIEGANHWVHATKPEEFIEVVINFIQS